MPIDRNGETLNTPKTLSGTTEGSPLLSDPGSRVTTSPDGREAEESPSPLPSAEAAQELIKRLENQAKHMRDERHFKAAYVMEDAVAALQAALSQPQGELRESWAEPNSGAAYTAAQLAALLDHRDKFIVEKGLWSEYAALAGRTAK